MGGGPASSQGSPASSQASLAGGRRGSAALASIKGFPAPAGPLDVVLERGTVVRISGRNGSGKTSLLRCLAGLDAPLHPMRVTLQANLLTPPAASIGDPAEPRAPTVGEDAAKPCAANGGEDPARMPAAVLARRVGMVHQEARDGLVGLTVAGEYRFRRRDVPASAGRQDVASLSSGEARRLAIDLAHGDLLLLDEPTEGLDPQGVDVLRRRIMAARSDGCVVVVDHEGALADMADVHIVLEAGVPDQPWAMPAAGQQIILQAPATEVRFGLRRIPLPPIAMPAGLHVAAGPNGSGKSTLLAALAGLHGAPAQVAGGPARPGLDIRWLSPRADDHLGRPTVDEELRDVDPVVRSALVPPPLLGRHPLRLSGGERKRVALAKVMGHPAPVYLLDEPEAHLDAAGHAAFQALVAQRIQEGSVVLVATHDPQIMDAAASVVTLQARPIVAPEAHSVIPPGAP